MTRQSSSGWIRLRLIRVLMIPVLTFAVAALAADSKYLVFVGTYTGKGSQGIYSYRFDPATGSLTQSTK